MLALARSVTIRPVPSTNVFPQERDRHGNLVDVDNGDVLANVPVDCRQCLALSHARGPLARPRTYWLVLGSSNDRSNNRAVVPARTIPHIRNQTFEQKDKPARRLPFQVFGRHRQSRTAMASGLWPRMRLTLVRSPLADARAADEESVKPTKVLVVDGGTPLPKPNKSRRSQDLLGSFAPASSSAAGGRGRHGQPSLTGPYEEREAGPLREHGRSGSVDSSHSNDSDGVLWMRDAQAKELLDAIGIDHGTGRGTLSHTIADPDHQGENAERGRA